MLLLLLFWCLALVGGFPFLPFVVVNCEPPFFSFPSWVPRSHDLSRARLSTQGWPPPSDPLRTQCCTSDPVLSSEGQRTMSLAPSKLELPHRRMTTTRPLPLSRPPRSDPLRKTWSSTRYRLHLRVDVQVPQATTMASNPLHVLPSLIIFVVTLVVHDVS